MENTKMSISMCFQIGSDILLQRNRFNNYYATIDSLKKKKNNNNI